MINHSEVYTYKSLPRNNPLAPEWEYNIYEYFLDDSFTEKLLIELKIENTKNALWGPDSVNSLNSWMNYNLFTFDTPVIQVELKEIIKEVCDNMSMSQDYYRRRDLWINGWVNYMTPGDSVRLHNHSVHNNSFLSGTLCLTTCDVITEFWIPVLSNCPDYGPLSLPSSEGRLIMFPSCIPHFVSEVQEKDVRFSIGFDLITEAAMKYFKENSNDPLDPMYRAVKYL